MKKKRRREKELVAAGIPGPLIFQAADAVVQIQIPPKNNIIPDCSTTVTNETETTLKLKGARHCDQPGNQINLWRQYLAEPPETLQIINRRTSIDGRDLIDWTVSKAQNGKSRYSLVSYQNDFDFAQNKGPFLLMTSPANNATIRTDNFWSRTLAGAVSVIGPSVSNEMIDYTGRRIKATRLFEANGVIMSDGGSGGGIFTLKDNRPTLIGVVNGNIPESDIIVFTPLGPMK